MKKPAQIQTHTYLINGEQVELVLDMRANDLSVKYAKAQDIEKDDYLRIAVCLFVGMVNSACMRTKATDEMITVDDIMMSDIDLNELLKIVADVKSAAYKMEYKTADQEKDLYADEEADNEKKAGA